MPGLGGLTNYASMLGPTPPGAVVRPQGLNAPPLPGYGGTTQTPTGLSGGNDAATQSLVSGAPSHAQYPPGTFITPPNPAAGAGIGAPPAGGNFWHPATSAAGSLANTLSGLGGALAPPPPYNAPPPTGNAVNTLQNLISGVNAARTK